MRFQVLFVKIKFSLVVSCCSVGSYNEELTLSSGSFTRVASIVKSSEQPNFYAGQLVRSSADFLQLPSLKKQAQDRY